MVNTPPIRVRVRVRVRVRAVTVTMSVMGNVMVNLTVMVNASTDLWQRISEALISLPLQVLGLLEILSHLTTKSFLC